MDVLPTRPRGRPRKVPTPARQLAGQLEDLQAARWALGQALATIRYAAPAHQKRLEDWRIGTTLLRRIERRLWEVLEYHARCSEDDRPQRAA